VEPDGQLTDEELRLLAAWRKFRDNSEDSPAKLSEGLHRLLVEAFGEERAAQLLGEVREQPEEKAVAEEAVQVSPEPRLAGCVLGGAVGDALGAPWTLEEVQQHNPDGVREYSEIAGSDRGSVTA
ncbi:ADP-ribosylglycohydrolase family protein, partial [Klebsiella pneumoniae]|nr:ADP-ribosylglycohydrolase family protein [Klebsiella pneumoniae]